MKSKIASLLPLLSAVPFVLGVIGYLIVGETVMDALYYSMSLYFINLISDKINPLIEIARWTAALTTMTAILYAIQRVWQKIYRTVQCLASDSVAVYTNGELDVYFDDSVSVLRPGTEFQPLAKSHVILFDDDKTCMKFTEEHEGNLRGKQVYIGLREVEFGLVAAIPGVVCFDIHGTIARCLWKKLALWNSRKPEQNITILGSGRLGQSVLNHGLLLNIYSEYQKITYHLIGDNRYYRARHSDIYTFNDDRVVYWEESTPDIWQVIAGSDLVIITEETSVEKLQTVGILCREGDIYYYSPKDDDFSDYVRLEHIHPFGRNSQIFTDKNIRFGSMLEQAKKLNQFYAERYGTEADWDKLDGFLQCSNISSADFHDVLRALSKNEDLETLAALEHIRWCRFHILNDWKYGIPEDGGVKDPAKRLHRSLRRYDELSEAEKEKNREVVGLVQQSFNDQKSVVI